MDLEKTKATEHLNAKKMPLKEHENILVFYDKLPTYNPQNLIKIEVPILRKGKDNGTNYGKSDKDSYRNVTGYPRDVLEFSSEGKTIHPTQKPVALFEYLIKTYTNENDLVLDNCMGSGTSAVAAINTRRNFIGFELDENYFNIAVQRINNHK
jgi:site-specific DNA-methyltransferase (adenine-specific)